MVVVVLVAYLALGGFASHSAGSNGTTFASADSLANSAANGVSGGPWHLVTAVGYAPAAASQTNTSSSVGTGCSVVPPGSGAIPSQINISAFSGSFSSGAATWWAMFYVSTSAPQVLLVEVANGAATPLLVITGGACVGSFLGLSAVPSTVLDSSSAMSLVWGQGGSAFVAAHSNVSLNLEMGVLGGGVIDGTSVGASWAIDLSPCLPLGLGGPVGNQPEFEAIVNSTAGTVTTDVTSTTC